LVLASVFIAPLAFAQSWATQACNGNVPQFSLDEQIRGCTALIDGGGLSANSLAIVYNNRGTSYLQKGDYDRAIADFDRSLAIRTSGSTYNNRGMAYDGKGQYERAIQDYDRAIALDPRDAQAYSNRGSSYLSIGQYDRALSDFDSAVALVPNWPIPIGGRGLALAGKGQFDRAIREFDRAIALRPNYAAAFAVRGQTYFKKGDYDRAIADFQRALNLGIPPAWVQGDLQRAQDAKAALLARAQTQTGVRIALIIGNGHYQQIASLPNAENDAADVAAALSTMGYRVFGYPLTNFTRAQMETTIDSFQRAAAGADAALVWYAGHGQEFLEKNEVGRNWLIPVDARINRMADVSAQGVAMSRLLTAVEPARVLRIVVIDACRNSNLPSATRAIGPRLSVEQRSGMMIVFSTRSGTVALDGEGRNSPFAAAFLEVMRDKPHLDVRLLFGAVAASTLKRTGSAQEPELVVRLQTDAELPLVP
jgi:tetratricopeptide (TPR) repeat protein